MNIRRCLPAMLVTMSATLYSFGADPVLDEYHARLTKVNDTLAEDHFMLGTWCLEKELEDRARQHFERTLALNPDHAGASAKLADLQKSPTRPGAVDCVFRMRNGDVVKGQYLGEAIIFETEYGLLEIPVSDMLLTKTSGGQGADRVFSEGFTGEGKLMSEDFPMRTKVGDVRVPRNEVDMIRFDHVCSECRGKENLKCTECNGAGRVLERGGCSKCDGAGKLKCATCGGKGKVTCPLCNGQGAFRPLWGGRRGSVQCPRCNGSGEIDCAECEGGRVTCPQCKGKPPGARSVACPVCRGAKTMKCPPCGGTGRRPLPEAAEALWKAAHAKPEPAPADGAAETTTPENPHE